jgi:hypothetical protein
MAPSVFDKYRIILLASEGCLNRDHVDLLLLNPAPAAGIYPTRMIKIILTVVKNKVKHPKVCFTIICHLCHIDDQRILAAIVHFKFKSLGFCNLLLIKWFSRWNMT